MNIILIGFMGAGKTAVGRLLASGLKLDYLDTDQLIEQTAGRTIAEIFKTDGEEAFRRLETEVLKTLQDYDNFVLSTGGGIVLRAENVALLKEIGPVVLLRASAEVLYRRIKDEKHRPLLDVPDPQAEVRKILARREQSYDQAADHIVETSNLTPAGVAKEISEWLRSK